MGKVIVTFDVQEGRRQSPPAGVRRNAMYLARDKNNDLYLFNELPNRGNECWWATSGIDGSYLRLDKKLYPEISWESEPLKVELVVPS